MKIYSYFAAVPELSLYDETKLALLWRERWSAAGFEPFILSEWHAQLHPDFAAVNEAVSKLPSVNPVNYERACWLRWVALAAAGAGFMVNMTNGAVGGLMSDLDVMPYSIKPLKDLFPSPGKLIMYQERAPSLVYADAETCARLFKHFGDLTLGNRPQGDRPHFSDQYLIEDLAAAGADWIEKRNLVLGYGDAGWETAAAVHYSNGSMTPAGKTPRWKHIPLLRTK